MKKVLALALVVMLALSCVFAQGASEVKNAKEVSELNITFVPSMDVDKIVVATEPLKNLLKDQLATQGWTVDNVNINVSTTYEAAGEALDAGTTDLAFIPAGTYVQYEDGATAILTATRAGKSVNSDNPIDWNSNEPITNSDELVVGYRSLLYSGITEKAKALAEKVNKGEALTWDELNACSWGVSSTTSSAGYIYPSVWLYDRYGKTVADLDKAVQTGYAAAFAGLASGMYDIVVCYADGRMDYEKSWQADWGRPNTIWEDTDVIGVTDFVMNDTISASKNSAKMTPEFIAALQDAFIAIAKTDEGKAVISIYNHAGYQKAVDSDYNAARTINKLFK